MKALLKRLRLFLGISYRCRCGAIVRLQDGQSHERAHDALREFFRNDIHEWVRK